MKKQDVRIGGTYMAKVTNKVVPVRIDAENRHGGWDATNMATNKKVRIKTAQRLRGTAPGRAPTADEAGAVAQAIGHAPVNAPVATRADGGQDRSAKVSCLDAAARVLAEAGEPMKIKPMVEAMLARGYWKTDAPTPWATLSSALQRELKRGDRSRFTKLDRGTFALRADA